MQRYEIIQKLINTFGFCSYLEIGVRSGDCFNKIECPRKLGVDVLFRKRDDYYKGILFKGTSDEFFKQNMEDFQVIFIDGDHRFEQVAMDFVNASEALHQDGFLVFHDMLPQKEEHCLDTQLEATWNGTVYKLLFLFQRLHVTNIILDTDWGCGIVWGVAEREDLRTRVSSNLWAIDSLKYSDFVKYKGLFNIKPPTYLETLCQLLL